MTFNLAVSGEPEYTDGHTTRQHGKLGTLRINLFFPPQWHRVQNTPAIAELWLKEGVRNGLVGGYFLSEHVFIFLLEKIFRWLI